MFLPQHLFNYIAMDALNGDSKFADKYTEEDKAQFEGYLAKQMEKIDLPNKAILNITKKDCDEDGRIV